MTSLIYTADDGVRVVVLDLEAYRAAIRRGSPVPPGELGRLGPQRRPRCGTPTGYMDHQSAGEWACSRCLAALSDARRPRRP